MSNEMRKLAEAQYTIWDTYGYKGKTSGVWSPSDVDKLEAVDFKEFHKLVDQCRFYYRKDPIAGTVVNKLVEIGVTDISLEKKGLSPNELRIFTSILGKVKEFLENCALEYLVSGLVIPEIKYASVTKEQLTDLGIKKYTTLTLPVSMWLRDPKTIKINSTMVTDEPSYYVILPEQLIMFIQNKGVYPDGNEDIALYNELLTYYPEFVLQVMSGKKEILLENNLIVRRKVLSDSPYPTQYLLPAIEALKHKRNLRRMDYSIASRVISAIMLVRLGNDEFPVTEDDESVFENIRSQMTWRNSYGRDIERIFQLFGNHTLDIEWVFPPVEALLDDAKYREVNQDIFFGLGFPRILTTGETERTQTSDPEFATMSPTKTIENIQSKLLPIAQAIMRDTALSNGLKDYPKVKFSPVNLHAFATFVTAMVSLYNTGNISRTTLDELFGFNWEDEMELKEGEQKIMEDSGLPEFSPQPFSPQPGNPQQNNNQKPPAKEQKNTEK